MLGKVLVGLLAAAAIAVGGYYYFQSNDTPHGCGGNPNPGQINTTVETPPCCQSPTRTAACPVCCEDEYTQPETLSIAPRVVTVETASQ